MRTVGGLACLDCAGAFVCYVDVYLSLLTCLILTFHPDFMNRNAPPPVAPTAVCAPVLGCGWRAAVLSVPLNVTSLIPATGSGAGGTTVTIAGAGDPAELSTLSSLPDCNELLRPSRAQSRFGKRTTQNPPLKTLHPCYAGFSSNPAYVAVRFGGSPCVVVAASPTNVTCVTSAGAFGGAPLYVTPTLVSCSVASRLARRLPAAWVAASLGAREQAGGACTWLAVGFIRKIALYHHRVPRASHLFAAGCR